MKILDLFLKDEKNAKETFPWLTENMLNYIKRYNIDKECELEVFLSYSHKDKEKAALVKNLLQILGLEAFMAHEDIKPTAEWENFITQKLKQCSVFVPILTKNFHESGWTDQESGAAIIRDMEIIPVSLAPALSELPSPVCLEDNHISSVFSLPLV